MTFWKWSQTAASNATTDSTINWAEGQSPSSVNDSARGMMAAAAKYRDDVSGAIVTGGTSTAYTVSSNQVFDTLAHLHNQIIAFTPHATNGATVTLNVDSLGAKPLRSAPSVELLAGTIIQGTPYIAVYNNTDGVFYLQSFYGNPYNIPLGASMDFWGETAPNSSFVLMYGQAISRTTYSTLFTMFATTYGVGDGSTTFNIPDCRGRFTAGKDDMGGSAASRLTSTYYGTSAAALGAASVTADHMALGITNLPPYTPAGSVATSLTTPAGNVVWSSGSGVVNISAGSQYSISAITASSAFTGAPQGGTSTPFSVIPPAIVSNKLLRII